MLRTKLPSIESILSHIPFDSIYPFMVISDVPSSPEPSADESSSPDTPGSIVHGSWQTNEDEKLREAVRKCGTNHWDSVSAFIPGRNATQCRERWMFRISPGLNKGPFERWEDELICRERERVGNHWTLISGKLPGRTSCAVKNRWYSALRQRVKHACRESADEEDLLSINGLLSQPSHFIPVPEVNF
jgi:hypothetical protein